MLFSVLQNRVNIKLFELLLVTRLLKHLLAATLQDVVDIVCRIRFCCSSAHFVVQLLLLAIRNTALDSNEFQHALVASTFENFLLDRVLRNKAVDTDRLLLTDTMSSSHRLQVSLGVPV